MASEDVQCPVCNKYFGPNKINTHVNWCLSGQTDRNKLTLSKESNIQVCSVEEPKKKRFKADAEVAKISPAKHGEGLPSTNSGEKKGNWTFMMGAKRKTISPDKSKGKSEQINQINDKPKFVEVDPSVPTRSSKCFNQSEAAAKSSTPDDDVPLLNVHSNVPLAERMRPVNLDDYIGQEQAVGRKKLLRSLFETNKIPSMILWGPPGCGKTTLAKIVAQKCKESHNTRFTKLSATTSGVADVKEAIKVAKNEWKMFKRATVLFIDEIHRFNKLQQDTFLPHVEDGTIILIGATTENPSFQVNNALLSRCRVITLEKLSADHIITILERAVKAMGIAIQSRGCKLNDQESNDPQIRIVATIEEEALTTLANYSDGDARAALNNLEHVVKSKITAEDETRSGQQICDRESTMITVDDVKDGMLRSHLQYDRNGEEHYNCASALQKSIRGSDQNGAIYWMTRMFEGGEDPLFIARRLVVTASEDIGMADPQALPLAVSTFQACRFIGRPECGINLAHCVTYLARAPKSNESLRAMLRVKKCMENNEGPQPSVPLHLRNAPTQLMKNIGYGKGYQYNHDATGPVDQTYLPEKLQGVDFFSEKWN